MARNRFVESISDILQSWGLALLRPGSGSVPTLEVYLERPDDAIGPAKLEVGQLSQEGGEFVFRYLPRFINQDEVPPISAFPDKRRVYRSKRLWPFFLVRLPPTKRQDVQQLLRERGIAEGDVFGRLEVTGARVVSSPYRLARVTSAVESSPSDIPAPAH